MAGSTSTKTGIRLFLIKHPTLVLKVKAGVITSLFAGKPKDSIPRNNADEPEFNYATFTYKIQDGTSQCLP